MRRPHRPMRVRYKRLADMRCLGNRPVFRTAMSSFVHAIHKTRPCRGAFPVQKRVATDASASAPL